MLTFQLSQSLNVLLFLFFLKSLFNNGSSFLCLNHFRLLTDSKSNVRTENTVRQCNRLHRESVARLTVNIPVKSDICFQSSPLSSLQQLPWKPQCHPPHCLDWSISQKLFQSPGLLKPGRPTMRAILVSFHCVYITLMYVCTFWQDCICISVCFSV